MDPSISRRAVIIGGLTALAGCLEAPPPGGGTNGSGTDPIDSSAIGSSDSGQTRKGMPIADERLPLSYSFEELQDAVKVGARGGAIPAIDDPEFVPADEAMVEDEDIVFGIVAGDTVKAYPRSILIWHEIVNDEVDDVPVAVTYCPLTGTVLGFQRGETTFGVSGRLVNNNLVLFDSVTDSWWSQILGTAIRGDHQGNSLRDFPLIWTTWRQWRRAHPDTVVLSRDTGYQRNYEFDPYGDYGPRRGYYANRNTLFPPLATNDRFHPKDVFVGTRGPGWILAIEKSAVESAGLFEAGAFLAVYDTALDAVYVYHNPDQRSFEMDSGTVTGPDGNYPPSGLPLARVMAFDVMWFGWAGFYPDSTVFP